MAENENVLENSLESTMNMSQDDIEKLLLQFEEQENEKPIIDDPDLESLLAGLDAQDDGAIQDISDLLSKSDQNQAVDAEVMELLKSQEEEGPTAYDAMDLFTAEGADKKEGIITRLLGKLKNNKKEKKEKAPKEKKQKKSGKNKVKTQKEEIQEWENIELQEVDETYVQNNSMNDALSLLTGTVEDDKEDAVPVKPEKDKKSKKKNKKETKITEEEEIREKPKKGKEKKDKNKESKEKKSKKENKQIREKIKEKPTIADAIMELEAEQEEPPHKNKVIMTFVASILIMLGFLVVSFYFTGHANKRLAEEAYEEKDYLECYQLLYGQKMNDSQRAMYKRSECILKTDIFWRDYNAYMEDEKWLEGLDELTQYVYQYPRHVEEAKTWNGQELVESTYRQVQGVLADEYETTVDAVIQIAELEDDADYTRALLKIVDEKEKREALNKKYSDMLPEEKDRLSQ